ncbi:MAG TPA: MBL fold metallo-hydrolase [Tepidisphaeraceae bacterium]|nr:MBL fold metallo-hydrolase [Tepidisphaeraceae bacterium]
MPNDDVELLFLGTGTSAGIPMIACHCPVCSSGDPKDKRTRCSVVIGYGSIRVLIDTTPELRLQCVANSVERIDAVVYTHAHADHIMGLDDLRRFNAVQGGPLDVWADDLTWKPLERCFGYAFREPAPHQKVFRPHLIRRSIGGPFEIGGITWTPIPLLHGDLPVLGFRVGPIAYCTDVSEIPEASFALLQGLDVLVLDALQHKKHTTHFSVEEAIEAARRIGAKQTLFTHIAHALGHEQTNRELPAGIRLAYDGQRVSGRLNH